jgi:hypothetical protein
MQLTRTCLGVGTGSVETAEVELSYGNERRKPAVFVCNEFFCSDSTGGVALVPARAGGAAVVEDVTNNGRYR